MHAQWIDVDAEGGGRYQAYLSLPPAGRGPGLVLFQEIFGVNAHIRAVADQYAADGFVVLAPDVFWRQAPRVELGYEGEERDRVLAIMKGADPAQLMQDAKTTVAALRARPEVIGKVGAIGYCLGGRLAFLTAATTDVDAAVCYYGGGIHDQLQHVAAIRCPLQFHYGALDSAIPPEAVAKVKDAVKALPAEVFVYDGAGHGFNCWARSAYHAPSAALAHGRALQFLASSLY